MARGPEFERRLKRIADRIVVNAGRAVKQAAVVVIQVVTTTTPVDTGHARSNWQARIDSPAAGVTDSDLSDQEVISHAIPIIAKFRSGFNRAIHVTNNVHYIRLLDAGSSAQAPQGMTAKAVQAANDVIQRTRLLR